MPNHIYSQLLVEASPSTIETLIAFGKDNDRALSSDKIFPMPPELKEVTSPIRIVSEEEYAKWKIAPREGKWDVTGPITARMQHDYINRFGAADWYSWAQKNWGTKWGIYDVSPEWDVQPDSAVVFFQTAWSPASPIIAKLAAKFPEAKMTYSFADEGGNYVGNQIYQGGELVEENDYEWKSPEGIETRKLVGYWYEEDEEDGEEAYEDDEADEE